MIQYKLLIKDSPALIKTIYKKFLTKDPDWHFFYEDTYMLLRVKTKIPALEKCLSKRKVKFNISPWEDPHPTVRKKQAIFKELFHLFSVLSMTTTPKEFDSVTERVIHCYMNMNMDFLLKRKTSESVYTGYHAISRARNEGMYLAKKGRQSGKK